MATHTPHAPTGPARPTGPVSVPFALAGVLYLALVAAITLGRVPWLMRTDAGPGSVLSLQTWLDPVTWSTGGTGEFVANIVLFVPVAVLLRLAVPRLPAVAAVAVGILLTSSIEVLQIPLDRVSDPRDLVANTIGAVIGTALTLGRRPAPSRRTPSGAVVARRR
ncbi:VanZ family protein [Auraticoccus monumenti]|uniref:VanZ like family protein n=1 Tax=Auraticoccus monumenti TaxID=675864 RepID=A0A1G6TJU4_9ACTN|nr:VanZ family protein [Auraticoccus monumenti]SDD28776.1 VanZ like family protein [Auraticoccus monumenti]